MKYTLEFECSGRDSSLQTTVVGRLSAPRESLSRAGAGAGQGPGLGRGWAGAGAGAGEESGQDLGTVFFREGPGQGQLLSELLLQSELAQIRMLPRVRNLTVKPRRVP